MGTKSEPGKYDCYAKAGDDEPLFVLRAKDPLAASLVRRWAKRAERDNLQPADKIAEARKCAKAMDAWWQENMLSTNSD